MSKEIYHQEEEEDSGLSTGAQIGIVAFFAGLPFIGIGIEMLGWGEVGLVAAGLTAGGLGIGTKFLIDHKKKPGDSHPGISQALAQITGLDKLQSADWGALLRPADAPTRQGPKEEDEIISPDEDNLFTLELNNDTGGVARLTIEQIVRNCQPNSYKIFIGRSMTKPGNKAVLINIYKQHFRFIGASQRGKSSMIAAFLDIVTRTHDPKHVRLVLLDKEDQTSNLFFHLPHVLQMKKPNGSIVKLHAKNDDEVLEYLMHCIKLMQHRYTLPKSKVLMLPIILVYLEEFLGLKDEFKTRIDRATSKEAKDKAISDYASLMYCIKLLAQQGLKVRIQLLLCAQVEYADTDFREAMANIGCGFSFCVRPTAAQAAGFRNNVLLQKNAEDNGIGQAVVETPDCNDLVLAPDFDLEMRLLEFEKSHPEIHQEEEASISELEILSSESSVNHVEPLEKPVNNGGTSNNVPPLFTPAQEVKVVLAYQELRLSGEKITRTILRDYLGWNSKQYQFLLKPICDKNKILMD
jgi:hypothetical protein